MSVVAFDMSLKSPGVAVYEKETQIWQLYCFSQKKTKVTRFLSVNNHVSITIFPTIPKDSSDAKRYKHIVDHLIPIIPQNTIAISIEAYAYPSRQQSGSNFKLHELGGFLKVRLTEHGFEMFTSVVSSSWKKTVVGKGNATKKDVLTYVLNNEPKIDLLQILNLQMKKNDEVPCPAQDLADAICIAKSIDTDEIQST